MNPVPCCRRQRSPRCDCRPPRPRRRRCRLACGGPAQFIQIYTFLFGAKFVIDTDLFLLELDLLLDLPLAQHLRLEVLGHVGDRGVERDAQKIDEMLEGAGTDS